MKLIIKLLGILIVLIGVSLLIKPEFVFGWIEDNMLNNSLYIFAIVMRLVFGIILIIAAKGSKYPGVIKFFGYLAVLAAIIFIFMGQKNFMDFVSSGIPAIKPYAALVGLVAILIGGFLIYAFLGIKKLKIET
jgi:hypothetical protein